jgi:hypothetical protein
LIVVMSTCPWWLPSQVITLGAALFPLVLQGYD